MSRTHPGRFHIAIPGPTNIPERILNAIHISSEDQRNPEIPNLTIPLYKDVKKVFKSEKGTVFLFPGSGTGAWESAITNTMTMKGVKSENENYYITETLVTHKISENNHLSIEKKKILFDHIKK